MNFTFLMYCSTKKIIIILNMGGIAFFLMILEMAERFCLIFYVNQLDTGKLQICCGTCSPSH